MKYLLLLIVVGVFVFMLGFKRGRPVAPASAKPKPSVPRDMVACAQCGLHLPEDEALPGRGGHFCSAAHRSAYEARHPT